MTSPSSPNTLDVGLLMTSNALGFQFSASADRVTIPIGGLVVADVDPGYQVFGIVTNIRSDPDAMGKAIATSKNPSNIVGRAKTTPSIQVSVATVGYREDGHIYRMMPPRPPVSLNVIRMVPAAELIEFTEDGSYLRALLKQTSEIPADALLAACLYQGQAVRSDAEWLKETVKKLTVMLRSDFRTLYGVLTQVADLIPDEQEEPISKEV